MIRVWLITILILISIDGGSTNTVWGSNSFGVYSPILDIPTVGVRDVQEDFKERMAQLESGGDHTVINRFGYIGKYQFGKKTLKGLARDGYMERVNYTDFLNNVELQEKAMDALIQCNTDYIDRNDMMKYVGKTIGGVKVTKYGMLAGAHLVGPYAVKRFLKSNGRIIKRDGNGTSVKDYMKEFEHEGNGMEERRETKT
jgi:hypothetical protein